MAGRATTKHDVAIAEVERKAERELVLARGVVIVVGILACTLPIHAFQGVVQPFAGRTTSVHVNVVVSITLAMSLALNFAQYIKGRSRKRELQRQRERLSRLETGEA